MNGDIVVCVRGVSKRFCRQMKRSMFYGMTDLARGMVGVKPDCGRLRKGEFWAVDDVGFDLRRGEVLGIMGENGSGKSTLLRILNGIFPPDRGEVRVRGRTGGLIALGAGMHPHMTGLENIYINGTILGMTRSEIEKKLPSILEFADIGEFMKAPLSTYSSGMKVRLGFAVAIHCDLDVLLLDEVLAVGDLAFQQKCYSRFESFRQRGVSTLFVSHSIRQVERLCDNALLLESGRAVEYGPAPRVIDTYVRRVVLSEGAAKDGQSAHVQSVQGVRLAEVRVESEDGTPCEGVPTGGSVTIAVRLNSEQPLADPVVALGFVTSDMLLVGAISNEFHASRRRAGTDLTVECRIPHVPLLPGVYSVRVKIRDRNTAMLVSAERAATLKVLPAEGTRFMVDAAGIVRIEAEWR